MSIDLEAMKKRARDDVDYCNSVGRLDGQYIASRHVLALVEEVERLERRLKFLEEVPEDGGWCLEHERRFQANSVEDGDRCEVCRADDAEAEVERLKAVEQAWIEEDQNSDTYAKRLKVAQDEVKRLKAELVGRPEPETYRYALTEIDRLKNRIDAAREKHQKGVGGYCVGCSNTPWPCPTVKALMGGSKALMGGREK